MPDSNNEIEQIETIAKSHYDAFVTSAKTTIKSLKTKVAELTTKSGNAKASLIIVVNSFEEQVKSITNEISQWNTNEDFVADAEKWVADLNKVLEGFNLLKTIGLEDLHAATVEPENGKTPAHVIASTPEKTLVKPTVPEQVIVSEPTQEVVISPTPVIEPTIEEPVTEIGLTTEEPAS